MICPPENVSGDTPMGRRSRSSPQPASPRKTKRRTLSRPQIEERLGEQEISSRVVLRRGTLPRPTKASFRDPQKLRRVAVTIGAKTDHGRLISLRRARRLPLFLPRGGRGGGSGRALYAWEGPGTRWRYYKPRRAARKFPSRVVPGCGRLASVRCHTGRGWADRESSTGPPTVKW